MVYEYNNQAWNSKYAAGPIISDDNDDGSMSYAQRLHRIGNSFHSFNDPNRRLPIFMQMHDIFPLSEYISTHYAMEHSHNRSAFGDVSVFSIFDSVILTKEIFDSVILFKELF